MESIKIWGNNPQSHLMLGQVYYWLGEKEKGLSELLLAEEYAKSSHELNRVGSAYRGLGLCDRAIRLFRRALEGPADRNKIQAYIGLGHCTDGEIRIQYFKNAVSLDPNAREKTLFFVRGKLSYSEYRQNKELKDLQSAIQWFQKAITFRPKVSAYNNDLAIAYMELYKQTCDPGALDSSAKAYKQAEKLHRGPLDPILVANVAHDYLAYAVAKDSGCKNVQNGTYQSTLRKVAKGQPVSTEVMTYVKESISHFERAITLSPEIKELYETLRSIYHGLGRKENVRRVEERASMFGIDLAPIQ